MAKDLFSKQSESYAKYRPDYPPELFNYILQFVSERKSAWDCATGNGQAAALLARNKNPSRHEIVEHMNGNICRCGTYLKIIAAIQRAAREG